jgi:hypothetical protein
MIPLESKNQFPLSGIRELSLLVRMGHTSFVYILFQLAADFEISALVLHILYEDILRLFVL